MDRVQAAHAQKRVAPSQGAQALDSDAQLHIRSARRRESQAGQASSHRQARGWRFLIGDAAARFLVVFAPPAPAGLCDRFFLSPSAGMARISRLLASRTLLELVNERDAR